MSDQAKFHDPAFVRSYRPNEARRQFGISVTIISVFLILVGYSAVTGKVSLDQFWTPKGVQVATAR